MFLVVLGLASSRFGGGPLRSCAEDDAERMSSQFGPNSPEARVAWSEVEDVRATRYARPNPDDVARFHKIAESVRSAATQSASYATYWRRRRDEMRRREIFLDLGELGTMPLSRFSNSSSSSTISPSPSSLLDTTYLLAEKAASADKEVSALFYEELEEVLSSDNSIAHRPSLDEDDSGLTADAALRLDLALELLECISWKAEQLGAFGNRRDAV